MDRDRIRGAIRKATGSVKEAVGGSVAKFLDMRVQLGLWDELSASE